MSYALHHSSVHALVLRPLHSETKLREFNKRFYEECRREAQLKKQAKTGKGTAGVPPGASAHQVRPVLPTARSGDVAGWVYFPHLNLLVLATTMKSWNTPL